MATYFFNDEQILMKIVSDDATLSNKQTQELSDGLLNDYLTVTVINDEELLNSEYVAVKSNQGNEQTFDMYRITNVQTNDDATTFTGIQLAYYELAGYVVEDIRPINRTVSYVASQLLNGTEWRVGYVENNLPNVTDRFYYLSAKDSFTKLQEIANCEVVFKVEISGQGVTDKWVEIYSQLGDRTLKRFNYGSNALTIESEIGKNDIYTALIGRGKGEEVGDGYGRKLTFEDVVWSTANGNPVNKPKGQKYIELPQATAEYGIKTSSGKVPRIGIVDFDETEDVNVLIQETYNALIDVARPKVQFKSTIINIGSTNIGDTVTIHRHDLNIHYETRVYKVVRDKLDDDFTEVTLGDAVTQSSTRKQARFYNTINNLRSNQSELATQVNYISQTADGNNAINWGNNEPQFKRTGDLWFRDHPSIAGERQMLVWTGSTWEIETDTSDLTKVEREIESVIAQAESDRTEAVQKINQAVIDAKVYADEVTTVSALRTKVLASDVITADMIQSNVSVVDKIFATDANVNRLTTKTAFINSIKAIDIAADRITTGTLNAANVRVINLDFDTAVGNRTNFVQSAWNSAAAGSVTITGNGIYSYGSDGDNIRIDDGLVRFYDSSTNYTGAIGTSYQTSGSLTSGVSVLMQYGRAFSVVRSDSSANNNNTRFIFIPPNDDAIHFYKPVSFLSNTVMNVGKLEMNGDIVFGGSTTVTGADSILKVAGTNGSALGYMNGNYLQELFRVYSSGDSISQRSINMSGNELKQVAMVSSSGRLDLNGINGAAIMANGFIAFRVFATGANVSYRDLNMGGNSVTNTSDRRLKNIMGSTQLDSLAAIKRWGFIDFKWKSGKDGIQFGLIAQDTPELQIYDANQDIYSVDSSKQTMMNSHAIQQLANKIDSIENIANVSNVIAGQALSETQQLRLKVEELENKIKKLEEVA